MEEQLRSSTLRKQKVLINFVHQLTDSHSLCEIQ